MLARRGEEKLFSLSFIFFSWLKINCVSGKRNSLLLTTKLFFFTGVTTVWGNQLFAWYYSLCKKAQVVFTPIPINLLQRAEIYNTLLLKDTQQSTQLCVELGQLIMRNFLFAFGNSSTVRPSISPFVTVADESAAFREIRLENETIGTLLTHFARSRR